MFWLNAFINTTCKILQYVYHNISTITVTNFIAVHFTKKKTNCGYLPEYGKVIAMKHVGAM
jgi:hypothetical protein